MSTSRRYATRIKRLALAAEHVSTVAIGTFRDGTLTNPTPLTVQKLRPFQSYHGSASLTG
ncbi:hypothetical protein D3C87_1928600 [compost metagenome]